MLGRFFVPALSAFALSTAIAACVGDDVGGVRADAGSTDASSGGTVDSANSSGGSSGDAEAGATACPANFGDCDGKADNGCEADLRVSSENCGACNRNCGGSTCQNSDCAPQKIVDARPQPVSFLPVSGRLVWQEGLEIHGCLYASCASDPRIIADVNGNPSQPQGMPTGSVTSHLLATDGTDFYFSQCANGTNADCSLAACSIGGCKDTGAKPLATLANSQGHRPHIVVNGGTKAGDNGLYAYHTLDGFYRYEPPFTPMAKTVTFAPGSPNTDVVQAIAVTPQNLLWVDSTTSQANPDGGLFICPIGGCGGGRVQLLAPPIKHLATVKQVAIVSSGAAASSILLSCAFGGCNKSGTVLATNQSYVSDIVADEAAVYWSTTGTATPTTNTVAGGQIMMCPLPDCKGGPQKIADSQLNPMQVGIDKDFVYWMNRGGPSPAANGSIWRKRR